MRTAVPSSVKRALVYEPHPEVRGLVVRVLERIGCEPVVVPASGIAASRPADVLIVDPTVEGGIACARRLRAGQPGLPLVYLANGLPVPGALELDPVAVLVKPFRLEDFVRAVAEALSPVPVP